MNCVLPVLLVLICLTFTKQDTLGNSSNGVEINGTTNELPSKEVINIIPPEPDANTTTSSPNTTPTSPSTTTNATTLSPPTSPKTLPTTPKSTTTSTTAPTSSSTAAPTTSSSAAPNITTVAPNITTVAPNITTVAPNITTVGPSTTVAPSTSTASPEHHRRFDGPSFVGGIVLALGLVAIGFVAFKFYKARIEVNYHTL